jgi:glycine/D-amino acid oxidase-like deaminating enzyme
MRADVVVVAAGNGVPGLLAPPLCTRPIPTQHAPGILLHTPAGALRPGTLRTVLVSPPDGVHLLQRPDG